MLRVCELAVNGGANVVQIRGHDLARHELLELATGVRSAVRKDVLVIVNGSLDVALEARADGVHLPEQFNNVTQTVEAAHQRGLLAGRSVHSATSAALASAGGADYLMMGTVFPSRSHPEGSVCGVDGVVEAVKSSGGAPVVGIGGITAQNARSVVQAGAQGVAVIGAIIAASDPAEAAQAISTAISSMAPF